MSPDAAVAHVVEALGLIQGQGVGIRCHVSAGHVLIVFQRHGLQLGAVQVDEADGGDLHDVLLRAVRQGDAAEKKQHRGQRQRQTDFHAFHGFPPYFPG